METGKIARQADGAVMIGFGETVVLACSVGAKDGGIDRGFFPLTVDYREKAYAAGRIPGGFFKREGRMGETETLVARMIDRPLRPNFTDGYKSETAVSLSVLSSDAENNADVLGLTGAAASLLISDVPFETPIAGVRVGRIEGELILNPTFAELEFSDLDVVVAGSRESITMVEGGCKEVSEDVLVDALEFAHRWIQKLLDLQEELRAAVGKPKREVTREEISPEISEAVHAQVGDRAAAALFIADKMQRQDAWAALCANVQAALAEALPDQSGAISRILGDIEKKTMRGRIINEGKRLDGRAARDVRPISCEVGILPRTHGSALFTRGETQALVVGTLGTKSDQKLMEELEGEYKKSYMLHYNFPAWSVGEARPNRGPGRREIGHGHLAERALLPVIPSDDDFPYTLRLVSEITESNGSSSMASVCGGSLAMMDLGVPIKAPVAGIAMGLVTEEGRDPVVLSDILGAEDHLGDMDFKVTGTAEGITAFQMDSKLGGITFEILRSALSQAHEGRTHILGEMAKCLAEPRSELNEHAPKIVAIFVPKDKIRDIIGPGGKMIRKISSDTGSKIDVDDDGRVVIAAPTRAASEQALQTIRDLTEDPEIGRIYHGRVTSIMPFGAFVEILPGREGLCHISELEDYRVASVGDVVSEDEIIPVQVKGIDAGGKISLSRRMAVAVLAEQDEEKQTDA
jgi:polyribonucleotide nucleotidyltransferase